MADIIKNDENLDAIKDNVTPEADTKTKDTTKGTKAPEVKTFTQEDVNKIVEQRLAKEKKRAEQEKAEAEKLAQMNADEKAKYELLGVYENLRFNLLNARIGLEILEDYEIVELLHREFNKNTTKQ